jgi:hypothetical protein
MMEVVEVESVSIFDDEISPGVSAMRFEAIRPPEGCRREACGIQKMVLDAPAIVREGACKRKTCSERNDDGVPSWPVWIQFLCALMLVALIATVVIVLCAIYRYISRPSPNRRR